MGDTALEFGNIFAEDMGVLVTVIYLLSKTILQNNGRVKLGENQIIFKNEKTGKLSTISVSEIDNINWQRLGNKPGIKIALSDGDKWRFGGFKESVSLHFFLSKIFRILIKLSHFHPGTGRKRLSKHNTL